MTDIPALYDKKINCTICNNTFFSKKIRSRAIRVEKVENDFSTVYKDPSLNPVLYEILVCTECGYAFNDQFGSQLTDTLKERFRTNISSKWNKQSFTGERTYKEAVKTFKLAILTANETGEKAVVKAGLCLAKSADN